MNSTLAHVLAAASPRRLPSYLIGGINVAVCMTLVTACALLLGGVEWAVGASLGAIVTSMADQIGRPQNKRREMLPSTFLGALMFFVSTLSHPHMLWSAAVIMAGSFLAALPQAWGKRGGPLSVSMLFSLVIPLAAPPRQQLTIVLLETALFIAGGLLYAAFSSVAAKWLDTRYRTLAVADCTESLARLMRLQAQAMRDGVEPGAAPEVVSELVLQQTLWADRLQTARDLVFNTLDQARQRQLAAVLLTLIEARDQLLTCQLDREVLTQTKAGRDAVPDLTAILEAAASHCDLITSQLRRGTIATLDATARTVAEAVAVAAVAAARDTAYLASREAEHAPAHVKRWRPSADASEPMIVSVVRDRLHLLLEAAQSMSASLADPAARPPLTEDELQLFTTPREWRWQFLRERLRWRSPILRFALRSMIAMGVSFAIAENLPWAYHKQWILISVAVVLRSSYAQTAERRNMRLIGTALGCLGCSALLAATEDHGIIFLTLIVAAGVAHAFPLVNYTVTATAATFLGLLQTHLLAPAAAFVVWERMVDTVLGIALAWAASFVLPSWERHQVPGLVRRVLQSQARYVDLTLKQYAQPSFAVDWRLARREVYDALATLTLVIQRMQSEPRQVRLSVASTAPLLAHSHELMAQMAAVKTLLTLRRANLDTAATEAAIERSSASLAAVLTSTSPASTEPLRPAPPRSSSVSLPLLPPETGDLTPWLQRRLALAEEEARQLVSASIPVKNAALQEPPKPAGKGGSPTRAQA